MKRPLLLLLLFAWAVGVAGTVTQQALAAQASLGTRRHSSELHRCLLACLLFAPRSSCLIYLIALPHVPPAALGYLCDQNIDVYYVIDSSTSIDQQVHAYRDPDLCLFSRTRFADL